MKMKNNKLIKVTLCLIFSCSFSLNSGIMNASELEGSGELKVGDKGYTEIVDPENPEKVITDTSNSNMTGSLRIDYVSSFDFGTVNIMDRKKGYSLLSKKIYLKDDPSKELHRGNFVQISDFRESSTGWVLQVKQEEQFKTKDFDELSGAVLSLDKGWANSAGDSTAPIVTRDTIAIENIGSSYDVARAEKESGTGIWSIIHGSSGVNNEKSTLVDSGNGVKQNTAVKLSIPDTIKIAPKEYTTKLTWILGELP